MNMTAHKLRLRTRRFGARRQKGVVLLISMIVLVALSLAGIALMNSVTTGILVAGNLGNRRATLLSATVAMETAWGFLKTNADPTINGVLLTDSQANGYYAFWGGVPSPDNPADVTGKIVTTPPLNGIWKTLVLPPGYPTVKYVINRMCDPALLPFIPPTLTFPPNYWNSRSIAPTATKPVYPNTVLNTLPPFMYRITAVVQRGTGYSAVQTMFY